MPTLRAETNIIELYTAAAASLSKHIKAVLTRCSAGLWCHAIPAWKPAWSHVLIDRSRGWAHDRSVSAISAIHDTVVSSLFERVSFKNFKRMKNIERPTSWGRNHGARKENMAPTLYGWIIAPLSISWCLSQMFRHVHPAWVPSMACHATRRYKELVHRPSDPKRLDVVLRFLEHVWIHINDISMNTICFVMNTYQWHAASSLQTPETLMRFWEKLQQSAAVDLRTYRAFAVNTL
jgi:hypothetical protein